MFCPIRAIISLSWTHSYRGSGRSRATATHDHPITVMNTISLRLPNYLHTQVRKHAKQESVSINQLGTLALAEKISALSTEDYFAKRASRGSRNKFEQAMAKVADVEPLPHDAL